MRLNKRSEGAIGAVLQIDQAIDGCLSGFKACWSSVHRDIREAMTSRRARNCAESRVEEEADEVAASGGSSIIVVNGDACGDVAHGIVVVPERFVQPCLTLTPGL